MGASKSKPADVITPTCPTCPRCPIPAREFRSVELCWEHNTVLYFISEKEKFVSPFDPITELAKLYHSQQPQLFHLLIFSSKNETDNDVVKKLKITEFPSVFIFEPSWGTPRVVRYTGNMDANSIIACASNLQQCTTIYQAPEKENTSIDSLFPIDNIPQLQRGNRLLYNERNRLKEEEIRAANRKLIAERAAEQQRIQAEYQKMQSRSIYERELESRGYNNGMTPFLLDDMLNVCKTKWSVILFTTGSGTYPLNDDELPMRNEREIPKGVDGKPMFELEDAIRMILGVQKYRYYKQMENSNFDFLHLQLDSKMELAFETHPVISKLWDHRKSLWSVLVFDPKTKQFLRGDIKWILDIGKQLPSAATYLAFQAFSYAWPTEYTLGDYETLLDDSMIRFVSCFGNPDMKPKDAIWNT